MTTLTGRTKPSTTLTGRGSISSSLQGRQLYVGTKTENSLSVIVTGFWNDLATWTETGKLWNDVGDQPGATILTGRTLI